MVAAYSFLDAVRTRSPHGLMSDSDGQVPETVIDLSNLAKDELAKMKERAEDKFSTILPLQSYSSKKN